MAQLLYPSPARRALITASVMITTLIVTIDMTITVVAVPKMMADLSAGPDQIAWVLTSYLIASAVMMPLSSWLASRFGRKLVMTVSVITFTIASVVCGSARSIELMVLARVAQGIGGAGLIPLGQATLLDINPPEKQPTAMAYAGLGAMIGPLVGPTLGGWLTDNYSWHWVFLINLPIGIIAAIGMLAHMEVRDKQLAPFDWTGFLAITAVVGGSQLFLDRGEQLDWFESTETCITAGVVALALYLLAVHMFTRRDTFLRVELFADRNFAIGTVVSTVIGIVIFASSPMLVLYTENLLGYSAFKFGLVNMPRAVGTIIGLLIVTRLIRRVDPRVLLVTGMVLSVIALNMFSGMNLETDEFPIMVAGAFQGFSGGMLISPLSALAFATLAPRFRNEGAAIFALVRNLGNSIGISAMQLMSIHASAQVSSRLAEGVRPDNPTLQWARPAMDFGDQVALARAGGEIARHAAMVATVDTFWMACLVAVATIPVIFLMRGQKLGGGGTAAPPPPVDH
ncbi:DHA2 family efflux MFS transporter permease subunit [Novosphingobium sp. TH158]|uniref:DHA2 family efflux MFS transporter permease subunit n=1 Tax=Novosphingobium sp. TH158 TaxID=2067455 RepID=UPI000C7D3089|nr:DHA2 family efflux MFS transporter permease subunit [Novosphingobium sp. TH158]PLK25509.1 EmrB/QacA family drug resistance transporter [Novosphingobium sp. TH158]